MHCWQLYLEGTRQGIGLRPAVLRLAHAYRLTGHVKNTSAGATILAYGKNQDLQAFKYALAHWLEESVLQNSTSCNSKTKIQFQISKKAVTDPTPTAFQILPSELLPEETETHCPLMTIQADLAICDLCFQEYTNPADRRYQYPFISCAQCGPRFSILKRPPFDRANTSFSEFPRCQACESEYQDATDRRFHAQTCSCPDCGPKLYLYDSETKKSEHENPIEKAGHLLQQGKVVTIKTPTGFQLLAAANQQQAIRQLRDIKQRPQKPFAVMFSNIQSVAQHCQINRTAHNGLTAPSRPIVLLPLHPNNNLRRSETIAYDNVAPGLRQLGCFLPTTGLHHSLLEASQCPLIVTSANLKGDFLYRTETTVRSTLAEYCQYYLFNNLEIEHPIDDSVIQVIGNETQILRRARGYVPKPIAINLNAPRNGTLGIGGGEKTSFAVVANQQLYLSQDFGDLRNPRNFGAYENHLKYVHDTWSNKKNDSQKCMKNTALEQNSARLTVAIDQHPDYMTSHIARQRTQTDTLEVQHHESHFLSALNENGIQDDAIGIIWDGAGLGYDSQIWGGEFFNFKHSVIKHVGQLQPFPLLGGDLAAKLPIRNALSLVLTCANTGFLSKAATQYDWWQSREIAIDETQFHLLRQQVAHLNSHSVTQSNTLSNRKTNNFRLTSSIGRLFDAVAALLNLCHENSYEGEAALKLMHCALAYREHDCSSESKARYQASTRYPFKVSLNASGFLTLDWRPAITALVTDRITGIPNTQIAHTFHWSLANAAVQSSLLLADQANCKHLLFTGGVWQNTLLSMATTQLLEDAHSLMSKSGHSESASEKPLRHYFSRDIPPNDAGIAVGQVIAAGLRKTST